MKTLVIGLGNPILGDDGVPVDYHQTYWKSEVIDFVILQQDAFDKIDCSTPIKRQEYMLEKVLDIYKTEFAFESFEEVNPFFKRLINLFKQINDKYGHAAGDAVLIQIAPILKMNMRPNDLVARYGGDEFVIQMNCASEVGMIRAREIRNYLQNYEFEWQGTKIKTTVSIGLLHPDSKNAGEVKKYDIETLLQKADVAMYNAKKKGRNTVVQISY